MEQGGGIMHDWCCLMVQSRLATSHNRPSAGPSEPERNQTSGCSILWPDRAGAATEDDALVSLSVRAEPYSPQLGPGRLSRALIGQPRRNTDV